VCVDCHITLVLARYFNILLISFINAVKFATLRIAKKIELTIYDHRKIFTNNVTWLLTSKEQAVDAHKVKMQSGPHHISEYLSSGVRDLEKQGT